MLNRRCWEISRDGGLRRQHADYQLVKQPNCRWRNGRLFGSNNEREVVSLGATRNFEL